MECSPPGSSVHGISQARILEWISISFSKEPSHPRGPTHISCIGRWILFHWATWEAPLMSTCCSSISKTCPTLHPHGLQHTRLPCPSSSHHLPEFAQLLVHWINDAIQPSHPVSAFSFSQHQGLFQWVSCLYQVAKYWSFIFSISPSKEYSGLISFKVDWSSRQYGTGTKTEIYSKGTK